MTVTHENAARTAAPAATDAVRAPAAPASPAAVPLVVGAADDHAEARADAAADRALARLASVRGSDAADVPDGPHAHTPGCGHLRCSTAPAPTGTVGLAGGDLDAASTARVEQARGHGRALGGTVRRDLETAFGTSLGHVRVHDDARSRELSRGMSANAFTTGDDVFLGDVDTATPGGMRVLAHEVAHVLEETGSTARRSVVRRNTGGPGAGPAVSRPLPPALLQQLSRSPQPQTTGATGATAPPRFAPPRLPAPPPPPPRYNHGPVVQALLAPFVVAGTAGTVPPVLTPAQVKALVKSSKALETIGRNDAARRREQGVAARDALMDNAKQATDKGASQSAQLSATMESALREERALRAALGNAATQGNLTMSPRDLDRLAYEAIWNESGAYSSIYHLRPMRETDAEVLLREVNAARTHAAVAPAPRTSTVDEGVGYLGNAADAVSTASSMSLMGDRQRSAGDRALGQSGGIGETVTSIQDSMLQRKHGLRDTDALTDWKKDNEPGFIETTTHEGAEAQVSGFAGVFSGITQSFESIKKFVKVCSKIHEQRKSGGSFDAGALAALVEAGGDALNSLTGTATSSAKLAESLKDSLATSVAKVVPGLNIVTDVLTLMNSVFGLVGASSGMHDGNKNLVSARVRGARDSRVDVMVHPLLRVVQSLTIKLEKSVWSTFEAGVNLGTSIATVATAGGFGVPTAVRTFMGLTSTVHSIGHLIADEVLRKIERTSIEEARQSLEGSAERLFEKSPARAVEAIIVRAKQGDDVALGFLAGFEVDGAPIDAAMLAKVDTTSPSATGAGPTRGQPVAAGAVPTGPVAASDTARTLFLIRDAVLDELGNDADPAHIFARYKSKGARFLSFVTRPFSTSR